LRGVILGLTVGCADPAALTEEEEGRLGLLDVALDPPLDATNRVDGDAAAEELGQILFFDPGLSPLQLPCAACHLPESGFADPRPQSVGPGGTTPRHSPTIQYAAWQRWMFWDGRADSLWSQALGPIENPGEMGGTRVGVVRHLAAVPGLRSRYEAVFGPLPDVTGLPERARPVPGAPDHPDQVAWDALDADTRLAVDTAFANVGKAIAAYERLLVPGPSRFDDWLLAGRSGEPTRDLLDDTELLGLKLFLGDARCHSCHSGPALSNLEFANLDVENPAWVEPGDVGRLAGARAVVADPFNAAGAFSDAPDGVDARLVRGLIVDNLEQEGQFKVPTLRNVVDTAPYLHHGGLATLDEVVDFYLAPPQANSGVGHRDELVFLPLELEVEDDVAREALVALMAAFTGSPIDPALTEPIRP
jgi:cytochrome c peroxidase